MLREQISDSLFIWEKGDLANLMELLYLGNNTNNITLNPLCYQTLHQQWLAGITLLFGSSNV